MHKHLLFLCLSILVFACSSPTTNTDESESSSNADSTEAAYQERLKQYYAENPLRDLSDLKTPTGYAEIDSIMDIMGNASDTEEKNSKEQCCGDYCQACRTLKSANGKVKFLYFKNDRGDYGCGNEQYYFEQGQLKIARIFDIWADMNFDGSNYTPVGGASEEIYIFNDSLVLKKYRETQTQENGKYHLEKLPFLDSTFAARGILKLQLENLARLKEFEGRD